MKKVLFSIACVASVAFLFNSCTMEKRHYMNGYQIDWNKSDKHATVNNKTSTTIQSNTITTASNPIIEENSNTVIVENNLTPVTSQKMVAVTNQHSSASKNINTTETSTKTNAISSTTPIIKQGKKATKNSEKSSAPDKTLLYVLCVLIPWLAVGLATDWDVKQVVINLLLCLTCIGGIIHAFIVVSKS